MLATFQKQTYEAKSFYHAHIPQTGGLFSWQILWSNEASSRVAFILLDSSPWEDSYSG